MYRKRIRQWGLAKRNREPEMRAVVRETIEREQLGEISQFRIRGKPIRYTEVKQYFRRRGEFDEHAIAQRCRSPTPESLECYTPLLSPVKTPQRLAVHDSTFIAIRDYCIGSFESKTLFSRNNRT